MLSNTAYLTPDGSVLSINLRKLPDPEYPDALVLLSVPGLELLHWIPAFDLSFHRLYQREVIVLSSDQKRHRCYDLATGVVRWEKEFRRLHQPGVEDFSTGTAIIYDDIRGDFICLADGKLLGGNLPYPHIRFTSMFPDPAGQMLVGQNRGFGETERLWQFFKRPVGCCDVNQLEIIAEWENELYSDLKGVIWGRDGMLLSCPFPGRTFWLKLDPQTRTPIGSPKLVKEGVYASCVNMAYDSLTNTFLVGRDVADRSKCWDPLLPTRGMRVDASTGAVVDDLQLPPRWDFHFSGNGKWAVDEFRRALWDVENKRAVCGDLEGYVRDLLTHPSSTSKRREPFDGGYWEEEEE